jgi:hypothetical protein
MPVPGPHSVEKKENRNIIQTLASVASAKSVRGAIMRENCRVNGSGVSMPYTDSPFASESVPRRGRRLAAQKATTYKSEWNV